MLFYNLTAPTYNTIYKTVLPVRFQRTFLAFSMQDIKNMSLESCRVSELFQKHFDPYMFSNLELGTDYVVPGIFLVGAS